MEQVVNKSLLKNTYTVKKTHTHTWSGEKFREGDLVEIYKCRKHLFCLRDGEKG
jgi:ribosomal protein S17